MALTVIEENRQSSIFTFFYYCFNNFIFLYIFNALIHDRGTRKRFIWKVFALSNIMTITGVFAVFYSFTIIMSLILYFPFYYFLIWFLEIKQTVWNSLIQSILLLIFIMVTSSALFVINSPILGMIYSTFLHIIMGFALYYIVRITKKIMNNLDGKK